MTTAAAKQPVEMFAETGANAIERNWIYTRIDVGQDEADDLEGVPECVVIVVRLRIKVEPQEVDMHR